MSLPEKPLTRRETYLAKAAGQEVTLPEEDITREEMYLRAIAEGGGGGGVTPEYVAEAIADAKTDIEAEIPTKTSDLTNDSGYTAIDDTTAAQNKTYSSAKVEEKVAGEEITTKATGSDLTLSTSAGNINALTVYGKSEVVDGSIKSAGEGWATVDLGTLNWVYRETGQYFTVPIPGCINSPSRASGKKPIISGVLTTVAPQYLNDLQDKQICYALDGAGLYAKNYDYTDATAFKSAMSGVILCYELSDPTQGNAIAIKTDNGSGIDGTMAVFETGTPLYGVSDTVRDVMEWNGSAGTVTKNCAKVRLADLTWNYNSNLKLFNASLPTATIKQGQEKGDKCLCNKYKDINNYLIPFNNWNSFPNGYISCGCGYDYGGYINLVIKDTDYTTVSDFVASLGDAELIYELATPTTQSLTSTENASIAGLHTFEPTTHAQNNAGADMTVEAYAGTVNGKAVQELKQETQSEISALKITQSGALSLTVADWSSNQQTVTYAHDTSKRNVIDVDPASVEEWASCGVLATVETASGITFTCKTVPENALNFRVTSMGV